jgi:hypothetical protein
MNAYLPSEKLDKAAPGLNGEPQNSRIANRRISKDGIASLNLFIKQIKYIPSIFNIEGLVKSPASVSPAKAGVQKLLK